jgi:hypothetical protein
VFGSVADKTVSGGGRHLGVGRVYKINGLVGIRKVQVARKDITIKYLWFMKLGGIESAKKFPEQYRGWPDDPF